MEQHTAEQQPDEVHGGWNTTFSGVDGEYGKSASLWLDEMGRHRQQGSSPSLHFQHIDRHLKGEAERWVLRTPSVRALVYKGYMDLATESDIAAFHEALSERFKLTEEEATAMILSRPQFNLVSLKQRASENLEQYYGRARESLLALHGCDDHNDTLTPLEISLRGIVVAKFVHGLRDYVSPGGSFFKTRLHQQQILHPMRTLYKAFKMAEVESRRLDLGRESRRLDMEKESKRLDMEKESKRSDLEKERKDSREKEENDKKRKLATEQGGPDNAKKQKQEQTVMRLKLSPTKDNRYPSVRLRFP